MVPLFRSFRDPLIVMLAVPLGLIGGLAILFATGTTLNIQSFMGTIFMVGIAQSNSTLPVEFPNRLREQGRPARAAVVEAAATRPPPSLKTAGVGPGSAWARGRNCLGREGANSRPGRSNRSHRKPDS